MLKITMASSADRRSSFSHPDINPFTHYVEVTFLRRLQVVLMSVTLAPVRLVVVLLCLIIGYIPAALSVVGLTPEDHAARPMTGWRRSLMWAGAICLRAAFFFAGFYRVLIKGSQASPRDAPVLCIAPHTSFYDIIVFCFTGVPCGVTRVENMHVPLMGVFFRATQPVVVSRGDKNSRLATISEMRRRTESKVWPPTLIFPEGTTTNGKCLISFKPGAFLCGTSVQPVLLKYKSPWDTYSWTWEGDGGLLLFWYSLCQWFIDVEVEFLPVYHPSEAEKQDPQLFGENVRQVMSAALGVPTTDHSYEDCCLMQHAAMLNLPIGGALVEFQKIRRKLNLDLNRLKELLEKFSQVSSFRNGHVDLNEFAAYMDLPISEHLRQLFCLYDRENRGYIDFREYVIGMSLLTQPANGEDTIRLAFKLFDTGSKGYITEAELADILHNTLGVPQSAALVLFAKVDQDGDGKINYSEFKEYAAQKPEYALLFRTYQQNTKATQALDTGRVKKE